MHKHRHPWLRRTMTALAISALRHGKRKRRAHR
jgi:hypothetical protein